MPGSPLRWRPLSPTTVGQGDEGDGAGKAAWTGALWPTAGDVLGGYGVTADAGPVVTLVGVTGEWQTYTLPAR